MTPRRPAGKKAGRNKVGRLRGNVITVAFRGLDTVADEYSLGALVCLKGAEKLGQGLPTATFILAFHALELSLKAYLAKKGVSKKKLRKEYSHNLEKLYDKAHKEGLRVPAKRADIEWFDEYHGKDAPIRYEFAERHELPNPSIVFPIIKAVLVAASKD